MERICSYIYSIHLGIARTYTARIPSEKQITGSITAPIAKRRGTLTSGGTTPTAVARQRMRSPKGP